MNEKIIKAFKIIYMFLASLAALAVLGVVFWIKIKPWVYAEWFLGADTSQYIYYVYYYLKHPHFSVNAWDYFWHNGVPRAIDLTWLHFTLNALLARILGLYVSIKIYPLIYLWLVVFFTFLLFWDLSGSVLIALGLTISLMLGQAIYSDLFSAGVVLSSISHAFLPMTLFFLVRFYKTKKSSFLMLGGMSAALGLYSHGLMGMFWIFIPSFIFLVLAAGSWRRLIDQKSLVNAFLFALVTLSVGAAASWPHLLQGFEGGSNVLMFEKVNAFAWRTVFAEVWGLNDPGVSYAFIVSLFAALGLWFLAKIKPSRLLGAFGAVMVFYLLWLISYRLGINPLGAVIFPGRIGWIWAILLGSMTAALLAPLSQISGQKITRGKFIIFNLIKLTIFFLSILGLSSYLLNPSFFKETIKAEEFKRIDLVAKQQEITVPFLPLVDLANKNVRLFSHIGPVNLTWKFNADIPLSEGYAHIWTKLSRGWEGWLFAVLSQPNWEIQEIPREMAKQQAKFFIDWYGIKYLIGNSTYGENAISPYFFEEGGGGCVESRLANTDKDKTTIYRISDACTSGIVAPVRSRVIGFVGSNDAYTNFVKDIASLNLNTSYLVPVKISESIGGISSKNLNFVDSLVIYEPTKNLGILAGNGWSKVYDFVSRRGNVWIETGGNSKDSENASLPKVFPIIETKLGGLGSNWEVGGKLADRIDFSRLGKLDYQGDQWKLSFTEGAQVKEGAEVLLTQKGYPIAVSQKIDKGKVLWTGINIFYRPDYFRRQGYGMEEANFVGVFLNELTDNLAPQKAKAKIERVSPEKILVTGQGFSGVLLKETNWPGWTARVESNGKSQSVPILTAGPELMYIPIPKQLEKGSIRVLINYRGAFIYWLSFIVSLVSFILIVFYLLLGKRMEFYKK